MFVPKSCVFRIPSNASRSQVGHASLLEGLGFLGLNALRFDHRQLTIVLFDDWPKYLVVHFCNSLQRRVRAVEGPTRCTLACRSVSAAASCFAVRSAGTIAELVSDRGNSFIDQLGGEGLPAVIDASSAELRRRSRKCRAARPNPRPPGRRSLCVCSRQPLSMRRLNRLTFCVRVVDNFLTNLRCGTPPRMTSGLPSTPRRPTNPLASEMKRPAVQAIHKHSRHTDPRLRRSAWRCVARTISGQFGRAVGSPPGESQRKLIFVHAESSTHSWYALNRLAPVQPP